ncbi:MAG: hypothetical protein F6K23_38805 [Okeania sp. SIO2C9]|nr:hypothetical protein [Okeania sp. SIO2C9]
MTNNEFFFIIPLKGEALNHNFSVNNFFKKLAELIKLLLDKNQEILKYAHKIRYWCQDESRNGGENCFWTKGNY